MTIEVRDFETIADKIEQVFQDDNVELTDSIVILMAIVAEMVESTSDPDGWYKHLMCQIYRKLKEIEPDERVAGMLMQ